MSPQDPCNCPHYGSYLFTGPRTPLSTCVPKSECELTFVRPNLSWALGHWAPRTGSQNRHSVQPPLLNCAHRSIVLLLSGWETHVLLLFIPNTLFISSLSIKSSIFYEFNTISSGWRCFKNDSNWYQTFILNSNFTL